MKVGLYFGSFNPIHQGHLIVAQTALNASDLEVVWFVVSPQNPFKKKQNLLGEYDRLSMVELAVRDNDHFLASNVEFSLPKPSYTIDTLTHLTDTYRSYEFGLIMGGDNLKHFHKWKKASTILKYYSMYVYPRPGTSMDFQDKFPQVHVFEAPALSISATYIRNSVKEGKSIRYLVPEQVREYIIQNRLYGA